MPSSRKKKKKLTARPLLKALAKIKVLVLDVDGVLTDSRIFWTEGAGWGAFYSVIDGFGIKLLLRNGIEVCIISAGNFTSHKKRAESLGIKHAHFGDENKLLAFASICKELNVQESECAFMGDELFDIPVLERAGFAATPPHASAAVKKHVNYVTKREGGIGAVREICDLLLVSRGLKL